MLDKANISSLSELPFASSDAFKKLFNARDKSLFNLCAFPFCINASKR